MDEGGCVLSLGRVSALGGVGVCAFRDVCRPRGGAWKDFEDLHSVSVMLMLIQVHRELPRAVGEVPCKGGCRVKASPIEERFYRNPMSTSWHLIGSACSDGTCTAAVDKQHATCHGGIVPLTENLDGSC